MKNIFKKIMRPFLQISLMPSSTEDHSILPLAIPFSLLQYVVLIEVYAEIQPHTGM